MILVGERYLGGLRAIVAAERYRVGLGLSLRLLVGVEVNLRGEELRRLKSSTCSWALSERRDLGNGVELRSRSMVISEADIVEAVWCVVRFLLNCLVVGGSCW